MEKLIKSVHDHLWRRKAREITQTGFVLHMLLSQVLCGNRTGYHKKPFKINTACR